MTLIKFKDLSDSQKAEFTLQFLKISDKNAELTQCYFEDHPGVLVWAQPWRWCPDHEIGLDLELAAIIFYCMCTEMNFTAHTVDDLKLLYKRYQDVS